MFHVGVYPWSLRTFIRYSGTNFYSIFWTIQLGSLGPLILACSAIPGFMRGSKSFATKLRAKRSVLRSRLYPSALFYILECSTLFASGKFSAAARQRGVIRNRRGFIPFAYSSSRSSVIALSTVSVVCKPNSSWGIRGCVAVRVCSGG